MPRAYTGLRFFGRRNTRRDRVLRKMAAMRAAKERRRRERAALLPPRPPPAPRAWPLDLGVRDNASGEIAWVPFRSLRDAMRRLALVRRCYQPAPRPR